MNLDPLSRFSDASEANVFVTAASLLANGNVEILEVYIFNRERMGILVSAYIQVLVSRPCLMCVELPGSCYHLCPFLNCRLRFAARHCRLYFNVCDR